jgi:AraC family transcriptional regulator of adaptative response / DNA-3-methyladenine glycosylase II
MMSDFRCVPRVAAVEWDRDGRRAAVSGRGEQDARFDGVFFTAVRTTGIYSYLLPGDHAQAGERGVLPDGGGRAAGRVPRLQAPFTDASPGSPNGTSVGRGRAAMRLIADGIVDREGIDGLARSLGYEQRQVRRVLTAELGASPLALARAQRAQTARVLVETTKLPMGDIAFAAGFASIRQFNATILEVFDTPPSRLRERAARNAPAAPPGAVCLRLPFRPRST